MDNYTKRVVVIREAIKAPTPAKIPRAGSRNYSTGEFILSSRLLVRVFHDSLEILRAFDLVENSSPHGKIFIPCLTRVPLLDHVLPPPFFILSPAPRAHSRPWSRTESITGYSVTRRCVVAPKRGDATRADPRADVTYITPGRYAAYRNSQFARAFTFEFPLLAFRIRRPTLDTRGTAPGVHHSRKRLA